MRASKIFAVSMLIALLFTGSALAAEDDKRVSLGFLYGWTDVNLVDRTNGAINQVSPTCLDLNNKGELVVTSNLTHTFVDSMHERGIKVTPFLSNHWARNKAVKALENPEILANQIVYTVNEYDLDGVNVDLENLTEEHRDALSNFVIILREKLPDDKLLTVSVAANPHGHDTGWQGSYDYKVLGENSDYLLIMAYDEHSQGGAPGPIASTVFAEGAIQYALEYVSKDKIVLGIPLFGRYWKYNAENDSYKGGKAIVSGAIPGLYEKFSGDNLYNEKVGESRYIFNVDTSVQTGSINGEALEDGTYIVWYSSNDSIKDKLFLVNQYDLLGAGVWALGQEKVEVWEYYDNELNRLPRNVEQEYVELVQEYSYETITEDLSPINAMIRQDQTTISIDNIQSFSDVIEDDMQMDDMNYHIVEEAPEDVEYKKEVQSIEKDKKRKLLGKESKKETKQPHHFQFEKVY